jgi:putative acetyltransferase
MLYGRLSTDSNVRAQLLEVPALISIRAESRGDIDDIYSINKRAFETDAEAKLVDLLRSRDKLVISLVAEDQGKLIGHIAFSRVHNESNPVIRGLGLGPMAVIPERQNCGIGSQLVQVGIQQGKSQGYDYIVVLGHPTYYPRFGFIPARQFDLHCAWEVPEEVFMALEVHMSSLSNVKGLIQYEPEFNEV